MAVRFYIASVSTFHAASLKLYRTDLPTLGGESDVAPNSDVLTVKAGHSPLQKLSTHNERGFDRTRILSVCCVVVICVYRGRIGRCESGWLGGILPHKYRLKHVVHLSLSDRHPMAVFCCV
jgi:hypothetical protein